ncbi:YqiJ family protein [uncultured Sphingomonas sp.]|uniref:YqiJ family protein n=1 Tax=uncultured Sphingomonas sp. TaxID=158754 RepID=UPI0025D06CA5|nr:YqiJ family protein [uncultured Sphingomonas sp.]
MRKSISPVDKRRIVRVSLAALRRAAKLATGGKVLNLLVAPGSLVFTAALVLMLAIGAIEALGLGASSVDIDIDGGWLDWLGFGRVPLLILLVAFLASFGVIGLAGQQIASASLGDPLPGWIAIPAAALASMPAMAALGRLLGRLMPHDETTALDIEDLIGRAGTVIVGRATIGNPARVRIVDPHGQAHYVLVEPNDPAATFETGDTVLIVRREGASFRAILHASPRHTNWMEI